MDSVQAKPHFSIPSIIAIGCAVGSFFVSAVSGFILALVAIAFGLVGLLLALSPSIRGGLTSMAALGLAVIGIVVAIARAVMWAL
jgi:hypothetical protein